MVQVLEFSSTFRAADNDRRKKASNCSTWPCGQGPHNLKLYHLDMTDGNVVQKAFQYFHKNAMAAVMDMLRLKRDSTGN